MTKPFMVRQGDVLLIAIPEIPSGAKLRKADDRRAGFILAEGEVTGHHHVISGERVQVMDQSQDVFVRIMGSEPGTLVHDEHAAITIPPGTYKLVIQREYQPKALPRRVLD